MLARTSLFDFLSSFLHFLRSSGYSLMNHASVPRDRKVVSFANHIRAVIVESTLLLLLSNVSAAASGSAARVVTRRPPTSSII